MKMKRRNEMKINKVYHLQLWQKDGSRKERGQVYIKYERLSIQQATSKRISELICRFIYSWRGSIY